MVWGLDSVVGSVQGLFSGNKTSSAQDGPASSKTAPATNSAPALNPSTSRQGATSSLLESKASSSSQAVVDTPSSPPSSENYWLSARSRKQFGVFAAGAAFLVVSTRITARALRRKYVQNFPAFYRPSNAPPANPISGATEAFEALSVASINVLASSVMVAGGTLWALDISSINDLRRLVRGGLGVDGTGRSEDEVEQEFEEWIASTLDRKRRKGGDEDEGTGASLGIKDREEVLREWRNERGKPR